MPWIRLALGTSLLLFFSTPIACAQSPTGTERGSSVVLTSEREHGPIRSLLSLDRAVLPGGPEAVLNVTFRVRNQIERPLRFTFPSGQQYDLSIEDGAGRTVWKWSDDRFFTMAIQERVLEGEWVFEEEIPLQDPAGRSFPPGKFVLKAWLTASGEPPADERIENEIAFQVEEW